MIQTLVLRTDNARERMAEAWRLACAYLELSKPVRVTIQEYKPRRSLEQNSLMWGRLTDIAEQVLWPVDGQLVCMTPEDWKHVLSAGLKKDQRVAAGVEGGFVILGQHTSRMTVSEMQDFIEFIHSFGSERGVKWKSHDLDAIDCEFVDVSNPQIDEVKKLEADK